MKKRMYLLLFLLGLAVCLVCLGMTVMAVGHLEWGRVLFYGFVTLMSGEGFVVFLVKYRKEEKC